MKGDRSHKTRVKVRSREEDRKLVRKWREEKVRETKRREQEHLESQRALELQQRRAETARRRRGKLLKERLYEYELDKEMIRESTEREREAKELRAKLAVREDNNRREEVKRQIAEWRESRPVEEDPVASVQLDARHLSSPATPHCSIAAIERDSRGAKIDGSSLKLPALRKLVLARGSPASYHDRVDYKALKAEYCEDMNLLERLSFPLGSLLGDFIATPPGSRRSTEECGQLLKEIQRRRATEERMADEIDRLEREGNDLRLQVAQATEKLRQKQRELSSAAADLEVSRQLERQASLEAERAHREVECLRLETDRLNRELSDGARNGALLVAEKERTIQELRQALERATQWAMENDEAHGTKWERLVSKREGNSGPLVELRGTTGDMEEAAKQDEEETDFFESYDTCESTVCDQQMKSTPAKAVISELQTEPQSSLKSRRSGCDSSTVHDLRFSPGSVSEASSRASIKSSDIDSHSSSNCSTNPGLPIGRPKFTLGPVTKEHKRRQSKRIDANAANACPTQ
ncbi:hypothetical protein FOL47_008994 [Perkinsus chesapeaki]|uniref:Uncharacterized protein n=1 Tax=Perkinsus chesapeaki TaxID=330153 RepID=A0A7J6MSP3_PERCH|nr:hypothetical protein FOL47_008994 [Perkinsus chesapeaki]